MTLRPNSRTLLPFSSAKSGWGPGLSVLNFAGHYFSVIAGMTIKSGVEAYK